MLISKYGPPLLCLKTVMYNGVKQITSAFRSGTNKISTVISNVCHDKHWGYNLVDPNDGIRYEHGCLKINAFRITERSCDEDEAKDNHGVINGIQFVQSATIEEIEVWKESNGYKVQEQDMKWRKYMQ
eukprot:15347534-Ditylum_brightwellii.AAC.1